MSILSVETIRSVAASTPPVVQDSAGTQVGTFCRAWVNFNGTGTVAIRAQFNVSSITDNGVGDYTVNFGTNLPDANYCAVPYGKAADNGTFTASSDRTQCYVISRTISNFSFRHVDGQASTLIDGVVNDVSVFR